MFILAHPGSGTRHLARRANRAGVRWNRRRRVREGWFERHGLLISERGWTHITGFHHVWHLVREPIRVVYTAARILTPPQRTRLRDSLGVVPTGSILVDMMATVIAFNERAEIVADRWFNIEDQRERDDDDYTDGRALDRWARLHGLDIALAAQLEAQTLRYGYST